MDAQSRSHHIDATFARLADAQYGVVSRRQLVAQGIGRGAISARLRRGLLVRLHSGVYAVGHRRLTRDGRWLAAVLAAGPDAVLSHRDAAALHGLGQWSYGRIEVSTPADVTSTQRVRVFGRRPLAPGDVTSIERIPVTSVARTLVDLAELLGHEQLVRALTEAERTKVFDLTAIEAARARAHGRRGPAHARLVAALDEIAQRRAQLTRRELELALRRLVRRHDLPRPLLNAWVEDCEVDAYWPAGRLIVETDGWRYHRDRTAFARDRAKTNRLTLLGYRVLRFTHDDITRRPQGVAAAIRQSLPA